jgi:hypothetical protein
MRKEVFEIKNDAEFEMLALSIFNYQIKKKPNICCICNANIKR